MIGKITDLVVNYKNSRVVPKVRKNLALVTHRQQDDPQIEHWMREMCQNMLCSYVDLFSGLLKGTQTISQNIDVDRKDLQDIYQALANGHGVVLAGTHTCGFDQAMFALNDYLPNIQILSKANPTGGTRLMYFLRKLNNITITPISVSALRHAIQRLHSGGVVAIAIDMPVQTGNNFKFFNQNIHLTDAHVRMAEKSGAEIFLVYSRRRQSGHYQIKLQRVRKPENCPKKKDLIASWTQKSYQQVEKFILRWPEAWYGFTFDLLQHPKTKTV